MEFSESAPTDDPDVSSWVRIHTRRVLSCFLSPLARAHGWNKLYLISPWISEFGTEGDMTFTQLLRRVCSDDVTVYVVSRPPIEEWHHRALDQIAATKKANIALVSELHTKLYCADTDQGSFALLGSANLTEQSLANRELGMMIRGVGPGRRIVQNLMHEAADIYRTTTRRLLCQRTFSIGD